MTTDKDGQVKAESGGQSNSPSEESKRSRRLRRRIIWTLLILMVLAGFAYHLDSLIRKYLLYEKRDITERTPVKYKFPKVSFCARSQFSYWRFYFLHVFPNPTAYPPGTRMHYLDTIYAKHVVNLWTLALTSVMDSKKLSREQAVSVYLAAHKSFVNQSAYSLVAPLLVDSMMGCYYNGRPCDIRNFTTVFVGPRSTCYEFSVNGTYNHDWPDSGNRNSTYDELQLLLNMKDFNFIETDPRTLDNMGEVPFYINPSDEFMNIPSYDFTGQLYKMTIATVSATKVDILATPVDKCEQARNVSICLLHLMKGLQCETVLESRSLCRQLNIQRDLASHCQCVTYEWPIPQDLANLSQCHAIPLDSFINKGYNIGADQQSTNVTLLNGTVVPLTSIVDLSHIALKHLCYMNRLSHWETMKFSNQFCPQLCSKVQLTTSTISFYEPETVRNAYSAGGLKPLEDKFGSIIKKNIEVSEARKMPFGMTNYRKYILLSSIPGMALRNYTFMFTPFYGIMVRVPNNGTYRRYQVTRLEPLQLSAELGGIVGLWIGASVVTLFELTEAIFNLLVGLHRRRKEAHTASN